MMDRRSFFKNLVGLIALPFAKDIVKDVPIRPSRITVNYTKSVPVYFDASANSTLYYWQIPTTSLQGQWISIDDAIDQWSGT